LTANPREVGAPLGSGNGLKLLGSKSEVVFAHADGAVRTHEKIRLANPDFGKITTYGDSERKIIETTVGRVIFSEIWPEELGFPNRVMGKSQLGDLIWRCYKVCGHEKTVVALDKLKEMGFHEATRAGVSIGIDDMIIPKEKGQEIEAAQKQISDVEKQYRKGIITPGER
jgi:DNA-directed RNA polymerase subunit beta'